MSCRECEGVECGAAPGRRDPADPGHAPGQRGADPGAGLGSPAQRHGGLYHQTQPGGAANIELSYTIMIMINNND